MNSLFQVLVQLWAIIAAVGVVLMNGLIAFFVWKDAQALQRQSPSRLKVLPPEAWAIVCFFSSLLGFGIYLALHYSTFAKERT